MSGWISVKERLPEPDCGVLVWYGGLKRGSATVAHIDKYGDWWTPWSCGVRVTHWQPLPEPPEDR